MEIDSPDVDGIEPGLKERIMVYTKELNVKSLIALMAVPVGYTLARSSRSTWIEVAFVDFHGTRDWYGLLTMTAGISLIVFGIVSILPFLNTFVKEITRWITTALTASALIVLIAIKIGLNQASNNLIYRAQAPSRFFEGTLLQNFGNVLGNISTTIASLGEPKLASGWKMCLTTSIVGLLLLLGTRDWSRKLLQDEVVDV